MRPLKNDGAIRKAWVRSRAALVAFVLVAVIGAELPAQQTGMASAQSSETYLDGSPYLSLGHWVYDYVNVLIARGRLSDLQPLVQPYRRIDVARALLRAERERDLSSTEREWIEELRQEMAYEFRLVEGAASQGLRFTGEFAAGGKAISQEHRDPLRPEGDAAAYALLDLFLVGDAPLVAGAFRLRWDNHLLNDPQFPNGDAIEFRDCDWFGQCAHRVDEGYLELQVPYIRLFFGRMARNWGLPGVAGLMVSDYSYSYDQLGYRFGNSTISLTGFLALPNDFLGDTVRYFTVHRLDWRIRDDITLAVSESSLWGGPGARFDLALINPVGIWQMSGSDAQPERNSNGLIELWWRPRNDLAIYGGLLVDNTMFGAEGNKEGLTQWGSVIGVQFPALTPTLSVRADLSVINSLAYRSRIGPFEAYTLNGISYGHDKTGAIVLSVGGDWFARKGLVLKPRLDVMWKGDADVTDPWPADAFSTYPGILPGLAEATVRPAFLGRARWWWADIEWDLGLNLVKNKDNLSAGWDLEGVGRLQVVFRKSLLR